MVGQAPIITNPQFCDIYEGTSGSLVEVKNPVLFHKFCYCWGISAWFNECSGFLNLLRNKCHHHSVAKFYSITFPNRNYVIIDPWWIMQFPPGPHLLQFLFICIAKIPTPYHIYKMIILVEMVLPCQKLVRKSHFKNFYGKSL